MINLSLIFSLFLVLNNNSDSKKIEYSIVVKGTGVYKKFVGYQIDNEGLRVGAYFFRNRIFKHDDFVYDSAHVPIDKISQKSLYRLFMFLDTHEFLEDLYFKNEVPCGRATTINIKNEGEGIDYIIIDNEYCLEQCFDTNRYLLNELFFLLNDLIPEGLEKFHLNANYCQEVD